MIKGELQYKRRKKGSSSESVCLYFSKDPFSPLDPGRLTLISILLSGTPSTQAPLSSSRTNLNKSGTCSSSSRLGLILKIRIPCIVRSNIPIHRIQGSANVGDCTLHMNLLLVAQGALRTTPSVRPWAISLLALLVLDAFLLLIRYGSAAGVAGFY
jgi:hypothetical protein